MATALPRFYLGEMAASGAGWSDLMQRNRYETSFRPTRRCACKDLMCRFRQDKDGTPRPDLPCPHITSETPGRWLYARA